MNENEIETVNSIHIQMDDLATGQLGPLAAWRLRRRIARDPVLAREFAEIQQMRMGLQSLARHQPARRPLAVSPATWTVGGLPVKRRAVLAACAFILLSLTGAVASRQWLRFGDYKQFTDQFHRKWDLHIGIKGKATVYDSSGRIVGQQISYYEGYPAIANARVESNSRFYDVNISSFGKHVVKNEWGETLGRIEMSPLTNQEETNMQARLKAELKSEESLRRNSAVFSIPTVNSSGVPVFSSLHPSVGLAAGYFNETGVSWKVIGYAEIAVECRLPNGQRIRQNTTGYRLPDKDSIPPSIQPIFEQLNALAPPSGITPQGYWQIAGDDHTIIDGHWRDVRRSGTFTGYGKHEVKDENGKTVLVVIVSPLTPPKPAR